MCKSVGPQCNLTTSVTSLTPSSASPTLSKGANTTTNSSSAHGGKGVDKLQAMTGKVSIVSNVGKGNNKIFSDGRPFINLLLFLHIDT